MLQLTSLTAAALPVLPPALDLPAPGSTLLCVGTVVRVVLPCCLANAVCESPAGLSSLCVGPGAAPRDCRLLLARLRLSTFVAHCQMGWG